MDHLGRLGITAETYDSRMSAASEAPLALAAEFPAATRDQWRELVAAVFVKSGRGVDDPEQALATTTYDGITIKPLYTSADAPATAAAGGGPAGSWDVRQRHADPDPARTNAAALTDLANGATSLWLVLGESGLPVTELDRALDGVYLDLAPVALDAGADAVAAAAALLQLGERRGVAPGELAGTLGADPIGVLARTGTDGPAGLLGTLAELSTGYPNLRVATVDATVYADAGASDAQELGIATAVGVAYLRELVAAGLSVEQALARLEFRFALSADQFASIAKLRAARGLWGRVAQLSGASGPVRGQRQHAVTSAAMLTRRDPWVNMLRTTIACFAAAVGGADAITVLPFDSAIGQSDDFARRIARNTQSILHDESSLARVVDAAGGSWYVESLTDDLARAAWDVFTWIERAGGARAALADGSIGALIATIRAARTEDIAHRRAPITGVSEFAFLGEEPVERAPLPAIPVVAPGALPRTRYAQDFEELRDRSDATPERPTVFVAALGGAHSARVGFATNLFAAGGVDVLVGTGHMDELIAAFRAAGTAVACLCGSDPSYAESGAAAVAALREAGATHIWLAGRAEIPGIDGTIYAGCDALAVLRTTLDVLGVK